MLAKRSDGFHDLESIFLPVPFEDCLEIERASTESTFSISGLPIEGKLENNLCWRAYELLKGKYNLPPVEMILFKQIPTGAGLGGGSSDAAFTLKLLNEKFNLKLAREELIDLASQLGSDCPFFIINKPCIGRGRGEILELVELPQLAGLFGLIVLPGIHISSGWAFQQITPATPANILKENIQEPVTKWKRLLLNDFEQPVFRAYPQLKEIKEQLYQAGAVYASLSGSGSAIYGLFTELPVISFPSSYTVKSFPLYSNET